MNMRDLQSLLSLSWVLLCSGVALIMQAGVVCLETGRSRANRSIKHGDVTQPAQLASFFFQQIFCGTAATIIASAMAARMCGSARAAASALDRGSDVLCQLASSDHTVCIARVAETGKGR